MQSLVRKKERKSGKNEKKRSESGSFVKVLEGQMLRGPIMKSSGFQRKRLIRR